MKSKIIALIGLLSAVLFSCTQNQIVELPLTIQSDNSPFGTWFFVAMGTVSEDENNPWKNTYPKVSKFPEGLTDMNYGNIQTNIYQLVYQSYLSGNITKDWYEDLQKSWNWTPDTLNLSKKPVRTQIAFAYGKDSEGNLRIAVDANGNLDLSDDKLFTALESAYFYSHSNKDSLIQAHAFDVSFEIYVQNKNVTVNIPLFIIYNNQHNIFMSRLALYATTQYKGEQIAVSPAGIYNSFQNIQLALTNNLKKGEKVDEDDIFKRDEYIEIEGEIYKILGVNLKKFALVLEKIELSKTQLFSAQAGHKPYPFQGEEFTSKSIISLESLKGKYVLLDFWSVTCGPCIAEFPHLKELYSKTDSEKFEIIGIVGHSTSDRLKKALEQHEITWPQILSDDTNKIIENYGIGSYPTTLLIDPEGVVVVKNLRGKELEEKVLSLILQY